MTAGFITAGFLIIKTYTLLHVVLTIDLYLCYLMSSWLSGLTKYITAAIFNNY